MSKTPNKVVTHDLVMACQCKAQEAYKIVEDIFGEETWHKLGSYDGMDKLTCFPMNTVWNSSSAEIYKRIMNYKENDSSMLRITHIFRKEWMKSVANMFSYIYYDLSFY